MMRFSIALTILLALLSGCAEQNPEIALQKAIVGEWIDAQGFSIKFNANGEGFIPGVQGKIPDSAFDYAIVDGTHISIELQGQSLTVEILVEDDTLLWKDELGEVRYTRVK